MLFFDRQPDIVVDRQGDGGVAVIVPVRGICPAGPSGISAGQCSQCHSTYTGDSLVPCVAGQQPAYLEQTMLDFKYGIRLNARTRAR